MDITSLYTVIPNGEGLLALKHFFDLHTVKEPSSETLLCLAELVLTLRDRSHCGLIFSMSRHKLSHKYVATFIPQESWRSHMRDINDI